MCSFFFFNDTATTEIYTYLHTLSLHDALPIFPSKKADKTLIDYLDRAEIKALLDAPDPRTRLGTRDRAMLHLTYAAGLRISELVALQLGDFPDRSLSTAHIMGKGRRERVLPLWKETQSAVRAWIVISPEKIGRAHV